LASWADAAAANPKQIATVITTARMSVPPGY